MPSRPSTNRAARRPETHIEESDIAAVFERRLLARGIRSDDFIAWRDSTELPTVPGITLIRFGRNGESAELPPLAVAPPPIPQTVEDAAELIESPSPDSPTPDSEPDPDAD